MAKDLAEITEYVRAKLAELGELPAEAVTPDTPLIGPTAAVKSRVLVELLLDLEDYAATELGCEFDWSSDTAFSLSRSAFRTVGTLAGRLAGLAGNTGDGV